jgi:hypothetical protein
MAGLFKGSQEAYYTQSENFTGAATAEGQTGDLKTTFTLTAANWPSSGRPTGNIVVFIENEQIDSQYFSYDSATFTLTFSSITTEDDLQYANGAVKSGKIVRIKEAAFNEKYGDYQYVSLNDAVNNFLIAYVGENKIISKVKRTDVLFHAKRGLAEFSYDTLKSEKSQEIEIPPSLVMRLPHDYVNYTHLSWKDDNGIEKMLVPTRHTSNPNALLQNNDFEYLFDENSELLKSFDSDTWNTYKSNNNVDSVYDDFNTDDDIDKLQIGQRYGINAEQANANGFFYIDLAKGRIHFSSNVSGKTVILKYISDSLGTDNEMQIHKFAEEALYKHIIYAILSTRTNTPEYIVRRFKKERFAAVRNAKIRLTNFKSEELAQVMRNKSKWIKH